MNKSQLLNKIQSYKFAAYDMLLYLDTHPKDKAAFKMYCDLVVNAKKCIAEYESLYGPLSIHSAIKYDSFRWTESPWPWEKEVNV